MNIVDSTLGDGGHAERILEKTAPSGRLLGIDADPESLARAKNFLYGFGDRVAYVRDNFENLGTIVRENAFGPIHGILLDLGWAGLKNGGVFRLRRMNYSTCGMEKARTRRTIS